MLWNCLLGHISPTSLPLHVGATLSVVAATMATAGFQLTVDATSRKHIRPENISQGKEPALRGSKESVDEDIVGVQG